MTYISDTDIKGSIPSMIKNQLNKKQGSVPSRIEGEMKKDKKWLNSKMSEILINIIIVFLGELTICYQDYYI